MDGVRVGLTRRKRLGFWGLAKRAQDIEMLGIKGLDALHLACAERLKADYFVTCDDRMIRKYTGTIDVVNPIELTMHVLIQETDNADS